MQSANEHRARRNRMAVVARCDGKLLQERFAGFGALPDHSLLRGPETGLVMLRGRVGGTGQAFNIGEATATRATVRLEDGALGHAMALGSDAGKVRLAAVIDAMCADAATAARIDAAVIAPLAATLDAHDETRRQETAATRVDFFTLVRGED